MSGCLPGCCLPYASACNVHACAAECVLVVGMRSGEGATAAQEQGMGALQQLLSAASWLPFVAAPSYQV